MRDNIKHIRLIGPDGDVVEFKINPKSVGLFGWIGLIYILFAINTLISGLSIGVLDYDGLYSIVDGGCGIIVGYYIFRYMKNMDMLKIARLCNVKKYKPVDSETAEFLRKYKGMINPKSID